jgi:2'-5' RNA ligase
LSRHFFALWPDEPAREALAPLAQRVASEGGGRPVPAANLHLTLVFLGEVPQDRVEVARRAASAFHGSAFDLSLDRVGAFARAAVGWAGPSTVPEELFRLQASLEAALRAAGFTIDDRPFAPHLTLARKQVRPVPAAAIEPVTWRAGRFALVRSTREAGAYTDVADWELGKGN